MKPLEEVKQLLERKPWFKASSVSVREKLLSLGEDCRGFLEETAARPNMIAGVRVLALSELLIPDRQPIFGIFPIWLVQVVNAPDVVYTYQYFVWRQGSASGAKGILLVEGKNGITHLILNQGEKFATGFSVHDCFGGFAEPDEAGVSKMIERFQREIREELGLPELRIKEVVDLGSLRVDAGMTPNCPRIFAGIIDGSAAEKINEGEKENPDIFELQMGTVIVPVERLGEFVGLNNDAFFLACLARFAVLRGSLAI